MKVTIRDGGHALSDAGRLALCGGIALYLAGNGAFRMRMGGALGWPSVAGVGALAAVYRSRRIGLRALGERSRNGGAGRRMRARVEPFLADGRPQQPRAVAVAEVDRPTAAGHDDARPDEHAFEPLTGRQA